MVRMNQKQSILQMHGMICFHLNGKYNLLKKLSISYKPKKSIKTGVNSITPVFYLFMPEHLAKYQGRF